MKVIDINLANTENHHRNIVIQLWDMTYIYVHFITGGIKKIGGKSHLGLPPSPPPPVDNLEVFEFLRTSHISAPLLVMATIIIPLEMLKIPPADVFGKHCHT